MNEEQKPKRAKRQFDESFRRQAVALVQTSGRPLREIAAELDVSVWNLRDWLGVHGPRSTPAQLEGEVARLMRELGLRAVRKGGWRMRTTESRHQLGLVAQPVA